MKIKSTLLKVIAILLLSILMSCGGSSERGSMIIQGSLKSELPSDNGSGSVTIPLSGVEICCGGQCDTTGTAGTFYLATDVASSLLCTATGSVATRSKNSRLESEGFVIIALGREGIFLVEVTVVVDDETGEPRIVTRTVSSEEENPLVCGNGVAEGGNGEDCDGSDLSGASCRSLGFAAGDLSCNADCSFNTSRCDNNENGFCGDGIVDSPAEQCEGADLNGVSCQSLGFLAGTLACNPDCMFDTTSCTNVVDPPRCGNGMVEAGEDCEGSDLRGETCESLGYEGGTLSCNTDCSYNETACISVSTPTCDDSLRVCANTGNPPECLACSCDDGFPIGDCSATCFDTGSTPTICSGGVGCTDGSLVVCPE